MLPFHDRRSVAVYSQTELEKAQSIVYETISPTLQHNWPLLAAELGCEVWVKHENHTPTGAFKVRGGLVYMRLRKERGQTNGVITASTGNHGQSIPFAAKREGVEAVVVVPTNNSKEKNAAMRALGAELVETGHDFNAAKDAMERIADERGLDIVPSFDRELVMGVTTYAHEMFGAAGELDTVYVPIGLGSGCCGVIAARDMLGLETEVVVAVVATGGQRLCVVADTPREPVSDQFQIGDVCRRHGCAGARMQSAFEYICDRRGAHC